MKLAYQNRWLRLLIEFFPALPEIRRYQVVPKPVDAPLARFLRRRMAEKMRRTTLEGTR